MVASSCSKKPAESGAAPENEPTTPSGFVSTQEWDAAAELAELADAPARERGAQMLQIYRRWAERDGEPAVLHAESHGVELAAASLREAFRGWLSKDADAARSWVLGVPSDRRQLALANALGEALADAPQRATWAAELGDSAAGRKVLSRAMAEWGRSPESTGALDWLDSNGGVDGRSREVGELVRAWADRDPATAGVAIDKLPPGEGRDAAVTALVTVIAPNQAEAARTWAETVGDEQKRSELLALVAKIGGAGATGLQP